MLADFRTRLAPTACRSAAPSPTPPARPGRWPTWRRRPRRSPRPADRPCCSPPAARGAAAGARTPGRRSSGWACRHWPAAGHPRGPFARRFGRARITRLDQALGREREALDLPPSDQRPGSPAWPSPSRSARRRTWPASPKRVIARLCARLESEGQGARRFEIAFHRVDGEAPALEVGLSLPGRDAAAIAKLFAPEAGDRRSRASAIEVVTIDRRRRGDRSPARQARLDDAGAARPSRRASAPSSTG